jgi:hypothetical protein
MSALAKVETPYKITEFQKHTGITYMSHPFSKKALMCFHILIYNSYLARDFQNKSMKSEIKEETLFTLLQLTGINARTTTKKTLEQLMTNPVKYNLLAKDKKNKNSWDKIRIIFTDFDFVTKPGYVIYKYNESFAEMMEKPNAYARFNILAQYDLNHFASIVLHSILTEHLHTVKTSETPWFPVEVYKEIMGISTDSKNYSDIDGFREVRKNYIKKPIAEINLKSNIRVTKEEIKKEGRKAVAVRFVGLEEHPYQQKLFDYQDITSIDELALMMSRIQYGDEDEQIIEEKEKKLQKRDILNLQKRLTSDFELSYYLTHKSILIYKYFSMYMVLYLNIFKVKYFNVMRSYL